MRQDQIETKLMHLSVGEFSEAQPFQILISEMYVSVSQWSSYSGESPRTNKTFSGRKLVKSTTTSRWVTTLDRGLCNRRLYGAEGMNKRSKLKLVNREL